MVNFHSPDGINGSALIGTVTLKQHGIIAADKQRTDGIDSPAAIRGGVVRKRHTVGIIGKTDQRTLLSVDTGTFYRRIAAEGNSTAVSLHNKRT